MIKISKIRLAMCVIGVIALGIRTKWQPTFGDALVMMAILGLAIVWVILFEKILIYRAGKKHEKQA